jgi:hypothetical protein
VDVTEDDAGRAARRRRWEAECWNALGTALGEGDASGSGRRFGDVWVMLDVLDDDALIQLTVTGAPLPAPGLAIDGLKYTADWETTDVQAAVNRVLGFIANVRADPIHQLIQKRRRA